MSKIHCLYRLSDKSYPKNKLPGASKEVCFDNFRSIFKDYTLICDNCSEETLKKYSEYFQTSLGNSGSFLFALGYAIDKFNDDDIVYFVEDDYLHRKGAEKVILEGLQLADYTTLYDHPDKYTNYYNNGEISQVRRTSLCHWRFTISTCMTFATTVRNLKRDCSIFEKHCRYNHPNDHFIFQEIGKRLSLSIPGFACHTDLTAVSHISLVDEWAIDYLISILEQKYILDREYKSKWDKLVWLGAMDFAMCSDLSFSRKSSKDQHSCA